MKPSGEGGRPPARRPDPVHRKIRKDLTRWADKTLPMLNEAERLACVLDLHKARSYRDMHRSSLRWRKKYAGTLLQLRDRLQRLMDGTPSYCSVFTRIIRESELLPTLERTASEYAPPPSIAEWRRTRPDPIVPFRISGKGDSLVIYSSDGPMPGFAAEALDVQRFGHQTFKRLRSADVPHEVAARLVREGLKIAGVKLDRSIDLSWAGTTPDFRARKLVNQPKFLFDAAKGGSPRRIHADPKVELAWWTAWLGRLVPLLRRDDLSGQEQAVLTAI